MRVCDESADGCSADLRGQGKTPLMHALGHAYLAAVPEAAVICMSSERFMFEFVQALRARDTFSFKARLRAADLLLIDDLQFIAGKDSTQEEFFHTINEIMAAGKRIVITADRCPQALDGVEPRILSRLAGGLVADLKAPERSEEHTSELQSRMRNSYAVFGLKKKHNG